jgi:hypothetical protein
MSWDADVDIKTECIDLSESSMPAVWGDSINKITLSGYYSSERKGYTLHFSAI